ADGRAVDRAKQGQRVGEPRGESLLVVRARRPSLLLGFAVVVAGEFRDTGTKDFRQQRRVGRQKRSQRRFPLCLRRHRFTCHVVVPSLWSSSSTPLAFSSSRMKSASLNFFAFRAALRLSMSVSIVEASMPHVECLLVSHLGMVSSVKRPRNVSESASATSAVGPRLLRMSLRS